MRLIKVFVDTAPLGYGGGIQVALEQYRYLRTSRRVECFWRFSPNFRRALIDNHLALPDHYYMASRGRFGDLPQYIDIYRRERPDVIYTVQGPSYGIRLSVPHVCGFARGWMLWPNTIAYSVLPVRERLWRRFRDYCKRPLLHNSTYFIVETEAAREPMARLAKVPLERVRVVGNTCADAFRNWDKQQGIDIIRRNSADEFILLVLSIYRRHKNLEIIPRVAEILKARSSRPFRFVLTISPEDAGWRSIAADAAARGVADAIETVGPLPLASCPGAFAASDACFLPTLLEMFTATYPEAMQMGCPLVTTDLPFARSICGDASLFFSPLESRSAAEAILKLSESPLLREELVEAGRRRLREFPDSRTKTEATVDILLEASSAAPVSG